MGKIRWRKVGWSVMNAMVSAKISFQTQGPESIQKIIPYFERAFMHKLFLSYRSFNQVTLKLREGQTFGLMTGNRRPWGLDVKCILSQMILTITLVRDDQTCIRSRFWLHDHWKPEMLSYAMMFCFFCFFLECNSQLSHWKIGTGLFSIRLAPLSLRIWT